MPIDNIFFFDLIQASRVFFLSRMTEPLANYQVPITLGNYQKGIFYGLYLAERI